MATGGNTRDVDLAIGVTTTGVDGVERLRKKVAELADAGQEATPEFARLTAELDKIAAQQAAIQTFTELRRASADTAIALQSAAAEVERLGAVLPEARDDAQRFAEAQAEGKAALEATGAALAKTKTSLLELRKEYPVGKRDSDAYKESVTALQQRLADLRVEQNSQRGTLREITASTREFAAVEKEVVGSYNQAIKAATDLSNAYGEQSRALVVARDGLRSVGLESTNLVEAQREITAAFDKTRSAIQAEADAIAAGRVREATATRDLVEANKLLASSFDFERTQRVVAIEQQVASARTKLAGDSRELVAIERSLEAARAVGDLPQVAALETQLATTRVASEATTRRLAAANAALTAELQSGVAVTARAVDAEQAHAAALAATNVAIDASVERSEELKLAMLAQAVARERNRDETRQLVEAERQLNQGGSSRRPLALEEEAVAEARSRSRSTTADLADVETRLTTIIRDGIAIQRQQVDAARERSTVGAALVGRTVEEAAAEERLAAVQARTVSTTRELADVETRLDAARKGGNQAEVLDLETRATAVRQALEAATLEATNAQQAFVNAIRSSAAAQADALSTTEQLAKAQADYDAVLDVEKTIRQAAAEEGLANKRADLTRFTNQLADAQKLLDAEGTAGNVEQQTRAELDAAAALQARERATRELAAAETLLNAAQDTERTRGQIDAEKDLAAAREAAAATARSLVEAERLLDAERTLGDRGRVATAEDAVTAARQRNEAATKELGAAEQAYVAEIKGSVAATDSLIAADRERAAQALKTAAAVREQGLAAKASLEAAFSTAGIRSAETIRLEIIAIGQALDKIAREARLTGPELAKAFETGHARATALKNELTGLGNNAAPSIQKVTKDVNLMGDAIRQATVYFSAFTVGKQFFDANAQLETLTRTLTIVTGSTQVAAQQIDFLRKTATDSGLAVGSITQQFSKFSASAVAAGIDLATVNRTFAAVSKTAGLLGLSSEDAAGALNALGQIASKGKVSLEELSQQLGDRLPAVLASTAKGLGITTQELTKLVETGKLAGDKEFFLAFSQGLEDSFIKGAGAVKGLNASLANLKNTYNDLLIKFGESGGVEALTGAMKTLSGIVSSVTTVFLNLGKGIGATAGYVVDLATKLPTLDFEGRTRAAKEFKEELARLGLINPLKAAQQSVLEYTRVFIGAGEEQAKFDAELKRVRSTVDQHSASMVVAAKETEQLAADSNKAAQAANDLGKGISGAAQAIEATTGSTAKLRADYAGIIDDLDKQGVALEKTVKARAIEADSIRAVGDATGIAADARRAGLEAANLEYDAALKLATVKTTEAAVREAEIAGLRAKAIANGELEAAFEKRLAKEIQLSEKAAADADKAQQEAEKLKAQVEAARLLTDTYGDQSASLKELQRAVVDYSNRVAVLSFEISQGTDRTKELKDAQEALARILVRVKDAVNDTIVNQKVRNDQNKNENDLILAKLNLQKSQQDANLRILQSYGQTTQAIEAQIAVKRTEIAIIEATARAKVIEADGAIKLAQLDLEELQRTDPLNVAKRQEIANRIANAEAKKVEAAAGLAGAEVQRREIELIRLKGSTADKAGGQVKNYGDSVRGAGVGVREFSDRTKEATKSLDGLAGNLVTGIDLFNDFGEAAKKSAADSKALGDIGTAFLNSQEKLLGDRLKAGLITDKDIDAAKSNLAIVKANAAALTSGSGGSLAALAAAQKMVNEAQRIFDAANAVKFGSKESTFGSKTPFTKVTVNKTENTTENKTSTSTTETVERIDPDKALELKRASLEVTKAQIAAELELASSQGDVVDATHFAILAKENEIELIRNSIALTNQNADANIKAAEAKIFELTKANALTAEKSRDLRNQIDSARIQKIETGVLAVQIEKLEAQVRDLKGATSIESALEVFGLQSQTALQQKADALSDAYEQVMESADLSIADQQKAFEQWAAAMIAANKGVESALVASERAALAAKEALAKPAPPPPVFTPTAAPAPYFSGGGTSATPTTTTAPAPAPRTVNIVLNGNTTPIELATDQAAESLVTFLSQLESDARSAGVRIGI